MAELSFKIKAQMAGFAEKINETVKKMKPVQIPTEGSSAGGASSGKTQDLYGNFAKSFQKNFSTMFEGSLRRFPNITKEVYKRSTETGAGIKEMFSRFGAELDSSESMSDALGAFKNLGDGAVKVLLKTFAPWGKWILLVGGIVQQFSKYAAEMEQTQMRFKRAFSRGGRSEGTSVARFQRVAQEVSSDGLYSEQAATEALGSIRSSNPYLSSEELEKSLKLGKEIASLTGGDLVGSTEKVASVLHSAQVDMGALVDMGVALNMEETKRLQALDTWATRAERNQMLVEKIAEANKNGAKEFEGTLAGQWQKFGTMIDEIKLSVGKLVAPIMGLFMNIANPIMEIFKIGFKHAEEVIGPIIEAGHNLFGAVIKPVGTALVGIFSVISNISKIILGPIIGAVKILSSFWKGFGSGNSNFTKKIFDFINRFLVGIQRIQQALMRGLFKMLKDGYNTFIKPFVDAVVNAFTMIGDYIMGVFNRIKEYMVGWYEWADKMTGGTLTKIGAYFKEEGTGEEQKKKEDAYQDPRMRLNVNFEDAASMTNRIQKSILERNSPQVKMVDLLTEIRKQMENITEGQKVANATGERQSEEMHVMNQNVSKSNMGLVYG